MRVDRDAPVVVLRVALAPVRGGHGEEDDTAGTEDSGSSIATEGEEHDEEADPDRGVGELHDGGVAESQPGKRE